MQHRAQGLPNLICNNFKFNTNINSLFCCEVLYLTTWAKMIHSRPTVSPDSIHDYSPINLGVYLIIDPTQTAMNVGQTLAQRRDDSTDVGPTLGQPTLLFGYVATSNHTLTRTLHVQYQWLCDTGMLDLIPPEITVAIYHCNHPRCCNITCINLSTPGNSKLGGGATCNVFMKNIRYDRFFLCCTNICALIFVVLYLTICYVCLDWK